MDKSIKIFSLLLISIFILIGFIYFQNKASIKKEQINLQTIQKDIDTAILSTQLSSYGWRTEEDKTAGLFALKGYVNSKINEAQELSKYNGPVPEGYNQEHYWKTGELIKK